MYFVLALGKTREPFYEKKTKQTQAAEQLVHR